MNKSEKKKSFLGKLIEKLDKKMKEKSEAKSCCGNKGKDKAKPCCSGQ